MSQPSKVNLQYFAIPRDLQRYIATIFHFEIDVPDDGVVEDYLFPEWGTVRFHQSRKLFARMRDGQTSSDPKIPMTGPRSKEIQFFTGTVREWGVTFHPLGWAAFIGVPASRYADTLIDAGTDPVFAQFLPLGDALFGRGPDLTGEFLRLIAGLRAIELHPVNNEALIQAVYASLLDPEVRTVRTLAQRTGVSERTLERLCPVVFGFTPKALLRRQRFVRSIIQFTLDPSLKWIGAMDASYHDQAQFVRDFRAFMGMLPREYAELDKPILGPVMIERTRFLRDTLNRQRAAEDGSGPEFLP